MCPNDFGEPMNRLAGGIASPVRIVLAAFSGKIQRGGFKFGPPYPETRGSVLCGELGGGFASVDGLGEIRSGLVAKGIR